MQSLQHVDALFFRSKAMTCTLVTIDGIVFLNNVFQKICILEKTFLRIRTEQTRAALECIQIYAFHTQENTPEVKLVLRALLLPIIYDATQQNFSTILDFFFSGRRKR
jgi:hypothetical protein